MNTKTNWRSLILGALLGALIALLVMWEPNEAGAAETEPRYQSQVLSDSVPGEPLPIPLLIVTVTDTKTGEIWVHKQPLTPAPVKGFASLGRPDRHLAADP